MWGPYLVTGLVVSALGLGLAVLALRGDAARGRRRCPRCWYDMGGVEGLTCPECGRTARQERDLTRTRRRKRALAAALLLVAIGQLGWLESRVRRGGWLAAVPTEVLIVGMPSDPTWWINGRHDNAEQDWSLWGRRRADRVSRWQAEWVAQRLATRAVSSQDPRDVLVAYINLREC